MDLFDIVAARAGGGSGGGTPQVQSDWNQNDSSKKDYIKNRTHWKEEIERDYTVLSNVEPDPLTSLIEYGKKIGLEIGKEYTLEAHLLDGTTQTIQATAVEMPEDKIGIAGIPQIYIQNVCTIVDGIVFDLTTETITVGDNCYYQFDSDVASVLEKGIIQNLPNVETVVHKIPKEYLPKEVKVDQVFNPESENAQSGVAIEQAIDNISINTKKLQNRCVTGDKIEFNTIEGKHIAEKSLSISKIYKPTRLSCILPSDEPKGFISFSLYNAPFVNLIKTIIHGEIFFTDNVDMEFHILITETGKGHTINIPTNGLSSLKVWVSFDEIKMPFFDDTYSYNVIEIHCGDVHEKMILKNASIPMVCFTTVSPGTDKTVQGMTGDTKIEHTILHQ